MAQYIDKDALVAEIKRIKKNKKSKQDWHFDEFDEGYLSALDDIKVFLDTLEVKEVDLEKEYENFVVDDPILGNFITNDTMGMILAKHFFELGLKTQHSSISIPNIDDLLEEDGIDPYSKDAKLFKECYYTALERFKEKKGE